MLDDHCENCRFESIVHRQKKNRRGNYRSAVILFKRRLVNAVGSWWTFDIWCVHYRFHSAVLSLRQKIIKGCSQWQIHSSQFFSLASLSITVTFSISIISHLQVKILEEWIFQIKKMYKDCHKDIYPMPLFTLNLLSILNSNCSRTEGNNCAILFVIFTWLLLVKESPGFSCQL